MKDFCETVLLILAIPVYLFLEFVGAHKTAMKIWCWAYDTLEESRKVKCTNEVVTIDEKDLRT